LPHSVYLHTIDCGIYCKLGVNGEHTEHKYYRGLKAKPPAEYRGEFRWPKPLKLKMVYV